MVGKKRKIYYTATAYGDIGLLAAIGRVVIGMLILIGVLIILDIFVYLGATGSMHEKEAKAAYDSSYTEAYTRSYAIGFKQAYQPAYEGGYSRSRMVNTEDGSEGQVGSIMELRIPTYAELIDFLATDTTDENQYIDDVYECFDFAACLNNAAEASGMRAAYVSIRGNRWAHAIVAFDTLDRGVVFIEPQSDKEVNIAVGESYPWWTAGASNPVDYNSPIEEIIIFW